MSHVRRQGIFATMLVLVIALVTAIACTETATGPLGPGKAVRDTWELEPVVVIACRPPLEGDYPNCYPPLNASCPSGSTGEWPECTMSPDELRCEYDYYAYGCPGYGQDSVKGTPPPPPPPPPPTPEEQAEYDHACDAQSPLPSSLMNVIVAVPATPTAPAKTAQDVWNSLTCAERQFVLKHPYLASKYFEASKQAREWSANQFGGVHDPASIQNAFEHAYWNCLMVQEGGLANATQYANAHENFDANFGTADMAMDMHNNAIGRLYYGRTGAGCEADIYRANADGQLWWYKNDAGLAPPNMDPFTMRPISPKFSRTWGDEVPWRAPEPPTVAKEDPEGGSYMAHWTTVTDPSDDNTGVRIEWRATDGRTFYVDYVDGQTETGFVGNLPAFESLIVRVRYENAKGNGPWSAWSTPLAYEPFQ